MRLKTAVPMMLLLLLCACGAAKEQAQAPVSLRTALMEAGRCRFTLELTADFGDYTRDYTLDCWADTPGSASMMILEPELAKGISAIVGGEDAQVSYDDTILAVEQFESRPISPMAAPYLLSRAWSEGYIRSAGKDGDLEQVHYLLGYGGRQLEIVTWLSGQTPVRAEITDGEHVLVSCEIRDFTMQKKAEEHENQTAETDLGGCGSEQSPAQRGDPDGAPA